MSIDYNDMPDEVIPELTDEEQKAFEEYQMNAFKTIRVLEEKDAKKQNIKLFVLCGIVIVILTIVNGLGVI